MELRDKVALVTGGTSGIGKAIARRCIEEGAAVAVLGHSNEKGRQVEGELRALATKNGAGDCLFVHADVSDSAQVRAAVGQVLARWRRIDLLVNNAALMHSGALLEMDEADWDRTIAVNLRGPFLLAKYVIPAMPPLGVILNISSVHAIATDVHSAAYSASKGGLEAFTRALALECHDRKIRVIALRLGAVDTDMLWENPEVKSGAEKIDPQEVARPESIAEAVLFLGSQRASFISGTVLTIDGGRLPILCSHRR